MLLFQIFIFFFLLPLIKPDWVIINSLLKNKSPVKRIFFVGGDEISSLLSSKFEKEIWVENIFLLWLLLFLFFISFSFFLFGTVFSLDY